MRKYNINKDIERLIHELREIENLQETTKMMGWKQILIIFNKTIGGYMQEVWDLCDKYGKHEFEIKVKKGIADGLGKILVEVDGRVKQEGYVREKIKEKTVEKAKATEDQKLQTL